MAKIHLHGHLAEHFEPVYNLNVKGPTEAVRALCLTLPGFATKFQETDYRVIVGSLETGTELSEQDLTIKTERDIHFVPVMQGAKNGGIAKIIAAAALIALAFVLGGPAGAETATWYSAALFNVGVAIGLQGISAMLSPQASDSDSTNGVFSNKSDTTRQGEPIPIQYGQVYSEFLAISANIVGEDTIRTTGNSTYNADIGGWTETS